MRQLRLCVALIVLVAAGALGGPSHSAPDLRAQGSCSIATALQVGKPYFYDPGMKKPIGQVLCGAFTGPGSEAMAVTFVFPVCWPIQRWVVFRRDGDAWNEVLDRASYLVPPLKAVGSDLREAAAVHRRGDPRCIPSGGTRARTWHWNGTKLAAGAWKQVKPPSAPPPGGPKMGFFKTPSGNIVCFHSPGPADQPRAFVECVVRTGLKPPPPRRPCREGGYAGDRVSMFATGRATAPSCAGDPGAAVGLRGARVLGYGKSWSGGGITCRSAFTGLTCRNKSRHGFFLSRARWRAF
jgi:hypothetical protein